MGNNDFTTLKVSRRFDAPKERLYEAWIKPEDLLIWWQPVDLKLIKVENDVREGGAVMYLFKNKEGEETRVNGIYEKVVPSEKLIFTWNWILPSESMNDGNFKLSIDFKDFENGGMVEVEQENFSSEDAIVPHKEGWENAFNDLAKFLSGSQPRTVKDENPTAGNSESKSDFGAPGINNNVEKTGYNEIAEQEKVGGYS